jgi:hypothetical protein
MPKYFSITHRKLRRLWKFSKMFLGLVLLVLEIIRKILELTV